jgi:hypothetical protein
MLLVQAIGLLRSSLDMIPPGGGSAPLNGPDTAGYELGAVRLHNPTPADAGRLSTRVTAVDRPDPISEHHLAQVGLGSAEVGATVVYIGSEALDRWVAGLAANRFRPWFQVGCCWAARGDGTPARRVA